MSALQLFFVYSAALIFVMLVSEFAFKFLKLDTEYTRKIAHIGSGIIALTYPKFIDNHWVVFALTLSFTLILYMSKKMGWFQSIFSVGRRSYGELFFVWSSWLLFLVYQYTKQSIFFYLPFSVVVFADPAAALIGKNLPLKRYHIFGHQKSYGGSFAFFIVTFLLSYFIFQYFDFSSENYFLPAFIHSFLLTFVEALSVKGWDNFTIPLASVLIISFF